MKRLCICAVALMLLCSCGNNAEAPSSEQVQQNQNQATAPVSSPVYVVPTFENVDVEALTDMKCSVRYSNGEKLVFEADKAKELYQLIAGFERQSSENPLSEEPEYVAFVFESNETGENISEGYIVHSNDLLQVSLNPNVSAMQLYQLPDGTYQTVLDKIIELS